MRYICHLELTNGIGTWRFKAEEGNSQGNKQSSCMIIRRLPDPTDESLR